MHFNQDIEMIFLCQLGLIFYPKLYGSQNQYKTFFFDLYEFPISDDLRVIDRIDGGLSMKRLYIVFIELS